MKKIRKMILSRFFDCGMLENKGVCDYIQWILSRFLQKCGSYKRERGIVLDVP